MAKTRSKANKSSLGADTKDEDEEKTAALLTKKNPPVHVAMATRNKRQANRQKQRALMPGDEDRKMPAIEKDVISIHSDDDDDDSDDSDDDSVIFCGLVKQQHQHQHQLRPISKEEQEKQDALFAASLHSKETKASQQRKLLELANMKNSHAGRSVLLVEKVIALLQPHAKAGIEPLGKDDAVFLAEQLFGLQAQFQSINSSGCNTKKKKTTPTHVSIGYHYTSKAHLESIRNDGLLTIEDRIQNKHSNRQNRAFFGNGIYTGTNPHAFSNFGDVGLLVAILKGKEEYVGSTQKPKKKAGINTVIGNKSGKRPFRDQVILQDSNQVLPLVKFQGANITTPSFAETLWSIHQQMQKLLDEYFNDSIPTLVTRVLPTNAQLQRALSKANNGKPSKSRRKTSQISVSPATAAAKSATLASGNTMAAGTRTSLRGNKFQFKKSNLKAPPPVTAASATTTTTTTTTTQPKQGKAKAPPSKSKLKAPPPTAASATTNVVTGKKSQPKQGKAKAPSPSTTASLPGRVMSTIAPTSKSKSSRARRTKSSQAKALSGSSITALLAPAAAILQSLTGISQDPTGKAATSNAQSSFSSSTIATNQKPKLLANKRKASQSTKAPNKRQKLNNPQAATSRELPNLLTNSLIGTAPKRRSSRLSRKRPAYYSAPEPSAPLKKRRGSTTKKS